MFSSEVYVCLTLVGLRIYIPTSVTNYLNLSPYVDYIMPGKVIFWYVYYVGIYNILIYSFYLVLLICK